MDILYSETSIQYKGNEIPEGKYRLNEIGPVGRKVEPAEDGLSLVKAVHTQNHIHQVQTSGQRNGFLAEVPMDSDTFPACLASASLAWYAAPRGHFACTRPPGHHATRNFSKGFCFFNNMAIVTQQLLNQNQRVCILDIDAHQGDGTEQIFYTSDQVLFISLHQEFAYPYYYLGYRDDEGCDLTAERHGAEAGEGFTINIPLPRKSGDDMLIHSIERCLPRIEAFAPDSLGISAGFDGYTNDALLDLNYSQQGYYEVGNLIRRLESPTFGLLEGGYHRDIPQCIHALVSGLNGDPDPGGQDPTTSDDRVQSTVEEYLDKALS